MEKLKTFAKLSEDGIVIDCMTSEQWIAEKLGYVEVSDETAVGDVVQENKELSIEDIHAELVALKEFVLNATTQSEYNIWKKLADSMREGAKEIE